MVPSKITWTGWLLILGLIPGCTGLAPQVQTAPESRPEQARTFFLIGQEADARHAWEQGARSYQQALERDPDSLFLYRCLTLDLIRLGRSAAAVDRLRQKAGQHASEKSWQFLLGQVEDALGDTRNAQIHLAHAAELGPQDAEILSTWGQFLLGHNQGNEGAGILAKALAGNPEDREARRALVQWWIQQARFAEAETCLRRGLELSPEELEWLLMLARVLRSEKKTDAMLETYRQVLVVDPDQTEAYQALTEYYLEHQQWDEAAKYLEAWCRRTPESYTVWRDLGVAYYQLGRLNEARDLFVELIRQKQADELTHFFLGLIYRQKKLWRLAADEFQMAGRSEAFRVDAALELAAVRVRLAEDDLARKALETLDPVLIPDPDRLLRYGILALGLKQTDQARQALQKAAELAPRDAQIQFHLGQAYQDLQQIPPALQAWKRAVALDPKFAEAYNYLGYICAEQGIQLAQAERWLKKAVALEPQNGNYYDSLGWLYYQRENYDQALPAILHALELMRAQDVPVDPEIYDHLGDIYQKLGRLTSAIISWEQALKRTGAGDRVLQEKLKNKLDQLKNPPVVKP